MKKIISIATFSVCLFVSETFAATIPTVGYVGDPVLMLGPEAQGIAGAAYAQKLSHDDLLLNPAAGAFSKEYDVNGVYSTAGNTMEASVFDTKSTTYGGGISYIHRNIDSSDALKPVIGGSVPLTYQAASLSVFGKVIDSLAIGITGRYSIRSDTGNANSNDKAWNGDVGAAYKLMNIVTLGAVYKNILADKNNLETRTLAGGVDVAIFDPISISGAIEKFSNTSSDPEFGVPNVNNLAWSAGATYQNSSGIVVRAGYRDSAPWKTTFLFAGLGFKKDVLSINYAFADVLTGNSKFTANTINLGLVF